MDSKSFSEWSEGLFSLAKIIALIAAGLWTYYQWDVSIFPKEDHEQFLRAAARRANIDVELTAVSAGAIGQTATQIAQNNMLASDDIDAEKDIQFYITTASAMTGVFLLRNPTPAPVAFTMTDLSVSIGRVHGVAASATIKWEEVPAQELEDVLGVYFASQRILESGASASISALFPFPVEWCCKYEIEPESLLLRVEAEIEFFAMDPRTAELVSGSEKRKRLRFFHKIEAGSSVGENGKVFAATSFRSIASVGTNPYGVPPI